jgi:hypothetical protein
MAAALKAGPFGGGEHSALLSEGMGQKGTDDNIGPVDAATTMDGPKANSTVARTARAGRCAQTRVRPW